MAKSSSECLYTDSDIEVRVIRQSGPGFRSPGIMRKSMDAEAIAAHSSKVSRRAKSTEPIPLKPDDPFMKHSDYKPENHPDNFPLEKRLSVLMKDQDNMSKTELVNCYRLLMSEKLRLERFLSIITKNNEMARNRLESDLLDAMMCIEDLKQALEVRMARRRKVDPREAEERRYLIRQNKKLLGQLYESAKKIEHLEVTKVEMKEQLELLDFQIVEVENHKAILEEELRKLPPCIHREIQTEDTEYSPTADLMSELADYQLEQKALLARQHQLEAVIRQLRHDNVELRDQLSKLEDAENSLTESDKPWAAGLRSLQDQLEAQNERVQELECKLQAARDYTSQLESKLNRDPSGLSPASSTTTSTTAIGMSEPPMEDGIGQGLMRTKHEATDSSDAGGYRIPHVDDVLLQETIRTFHSLLSERDQEIAQLKHQLRYLQAENPNAVEMPELPTFTEATAQTDLTLDAAEQVSELTETLANGGLVVSYEQYTQLCDTVEAAAIAIQPNSLERPTNAPMWQQEAISPAQKLVSSVERLHQLISSRLIELQHAGDANPNNLSLDGNVEDSGQSATDANSTHSSTLQHEVERLKVEIQKLQRTTTSCPTKPDGLPSKDPSETPTTQPDQSASNKWEYFSTELQHLRDTNELELLQSRLQLTERRHQDLEKQIKELMEELSQAQAEARSTETSLVAARRTEVALRRRLIAAMDVPPSNRRAGVTSEIAGSVRHSISATLSAAANDIRDTVDMQASLISVESRNTALLEAAQLDRVRLHEQTVRISQLEAEHRALMTRLGQLQASEATAHRGIVRLQALYEDMLREYSESRSQDFTWKPRSRSRSALTHPGNRDTIATNGMSSSGKHIHRSRAGKPPNPKSSESLNHEVKSVADEATTSRIV